MQCPHCLQHFHVQWATTPIREGTRNGLMWVAASAECPACNRVIVRLGEAAILPGPNGPVFHAAPPVIDKFKLVVPKAISRTPIPAEVSEEFAENYTQACLVLPDSEKASAALSRRCLQHILREKAGIKKGI